MGHMTKRLTTMVLPVDYEALSWPPAGMNDDDDAVSRQGDEMMAFLDQEHRTVPRDARPPTARVFLIHRAAVNANSGGRLLAGTIRRRPEHCAMDSRLRFALSLLGTILMVLVYEAITCKAYEASCIGTAAGQGLDVTRERQNVDPTLDATVLFLAVATNSNLGDVGDADNRKVCISEHPKTLDLRKHSMEEEDPTPAHKSEPFAGTEKSDETEEREANVEHIRGSITSLSGEPMWKTVLLYGLAINTSTVERALFPSVAEARFQQSCQRNTPAPWSPAVSKEEINAALSTVVDAIEKATGHRLGVYWQDAAPCWGGQPGSDLTLYIVSNHTAPLSTVAGCFEASRCIDPEALLAPRKCRKTLLAFAYMAKKLNLGRIETLLCYHQVSTRMTNHHNADGSLTIMLRRPVRP